jgi:hypothetical protein
MPRIFDDVAECVEATLGRVGPDIVLALPLGIGKPNPLANEFYRRARRDSALTLKIFTALSLRGQYNFVAMAHALPDARSILTLRSTREKNSTVTSNILWNYGNTTIPRHLRDIVVTEYGVADLRGLTDEDVIAAMLNIADSRFQDGLKREAQAARKLRHDYVIPEMHRNNTPRGLEERFILARARGLFSEFPFGSDFTGEEIVLAKALTRLKEKTAGGWPRVKTLLDAVIYRGIPATIRPYLERMSLNAPQTRQEWLWQRLLVQELRSMT